VANAGLKVAEFSIGCEESVPFVRTLGKRVATKGLTLDAASTIMANRHGETAAGVERQAVDGLAGDWAWVDFNAPIGPGQAPWTEVAEKQGMPHPGCFVLRVRKNMKRKELVFFAVQKNA
jgi:hypothetical protein